MPVATRMRIEALVEDLGGRSEVARAIGVNRAQVTRWLDARQEPDQANVRRVEALDLVMARLLRLYDRDTALRWLHGMNAHLHDRQPIVALAQGDLPGVLGAIDAEESGAFA